MMIARNAIRFGTALLAVGLAAGGLAGCRWISRANIDALGRDSAQPRRPVYRVTPLNTGLCYMGAKHVLGDDYSDEQRIPFALYSFLIEGPNGELLIVDFGPKDPEYFNEMFRRIGLFRERGDGRACPDDVVQAEGNTRDHLARLGIAPAKVGHIIFTHLHYDHLGGSRPPDVGLLADFPNAVVHISKKGWQRNLDSRKDGWQWSSYVDFDISQHILERGQKGMARFADDTTILPGIRTVWLGGHSPCSQAILVDTADGTAIIAGDVVYHFEYLEKGIVARLRTSDKAWIAASDRLVALAEETGGVLLPVHEPLLGQAYKKAGRRWLRSLKPLSDRAVAGWKSRRDKLTILSKHRNP
jgi:glyoxylase-like metal-dependent hydrolase (beta-lactamase superfamily II)